MSAFNVLARELSVHRNAFLEASAGTGKTFAIENIVVRLLIESDPQHIPLILERILVVTFTRASTRDLKARIRANLEGILSHLENHLVSRKVEGVLPDYLLNITEKGTEAVRLAKRKIEQALFIFDRAQIFTIHGFCWRMLKSYAVEAGVSLAAVSSEQEEYPKTRLLQVVRDCIRTELTDKAYSARQLNIALKSKRSIGKLQEDIFKLVSKGIKIEQLPDISQLFERFQDAMKNLKGGYGFEGHKIVADFLVHAPAYNKLTIGKTQTIKPEVLRTIQKFAALFDKDIWTQSDFDLLIDDGLLLVEVLSPENKQKKDVKIALEDLHYPHLLTLLQEHLAPIVNFARDKEAIVARMAADCQALMWHYQRQEEMIGHNDLLQQMLAAIQIPLFATKVRSSFDAVIIDEFQDTDPVQWDIFRSLFYKEFWKGYFYLVGDPKQSIYAFRQADIYTYLSAANTLGKESWATLDTNFRSRPQLVQALNTLFLAADYLFPLPRQQQILKYRPVEAGRKDVADFEGPSVHFWMALSQKATSLYALEEHYFFPAIVKEISRLNHEYGLCLRQCAVLVADRYQANRLMQYFKQSGMPYFSQRGEGLKDSLAVHAMRDVLKGILHYSHVSSLKLALASKIIGLGHVEMQSFDLSERHGAVVGLCDQLRHVLVHEGAAVFFPMLLQSVWHADGQSVLSRLLGQHDGIAFYREWQDIADLLIEEQAAGHLSADELISVLDNFEELAVNEEERLKATIDHEQEGVSILTSHVSKGLEFDIVFALGLVKRTKAPERLIPAEKDGQRYLTLVGEEDARYKKHCEELDAEKMRQLYVALTRAKLSIYLPVDVQLQPKTLRFGEASPMDLLLARLAKGQRSLVSNNYYNELYARISVEDGSALREFVKGCNVEITFEELSQETHIPSFTSSVQRRVLLPPKTVTIPGESLFVQSFTSLSQVGVGVPETHRKEEIAPHDFICQVAKSSHHLPAGSDTGTLLHKILECVPFAEAKRWNAMVDVIEWVRPFLKDTLFGEWEEVIASMVFNAFKTPLPGIYGGFCLAEVNPKKVYRETKFFYSSSRMVEDKGLLFDDNGVKKGFLNGVIDLFFEHEGMYYLLDWKSNWLGLGVENYDEKGISAAMLQNNYHLQAGIYAEAMRRYLKLFDKGPFDALFGGVYYLFLRGISSNSGIYHFYPTGRI